MEGEGGERERERGGVGSGAPCQRSVARSRPEREQGGEGRTGFARANCVARVAARRVSTTIWVGALRLGAAYGRGRTVHLATTSRVEKTEPRIWRGSRQCHPSGSASGPGSGVFSR